MVVAILSALPPVLECAQSETYLDACRAIVEPAVGDIDLKHPGVVPEAVVVVVEGLEITRDVAENDGAPALAHLEGGCNVEIRLRVVHGGQVHEERLLVRRLAIFRIDLTCNGFHSVDNGGQAFCDLDALKPLARDIGQSERCRDSPHCRSVLVQHLGIDSAEPEQPDLSGSGDRI